MTPQVEHLREGGFACGVHAERRATRDPDLFLRSNVPDSDAVFRALCKDGSPLKGFTAKDFRDAGTGLQVGVPPERIDILQRIDGVSFDQAWKNYVDGLIDGDTPTLVISREDLIGMKLASGRPRHLLEVQRASESGAVCAKRRPRVSPRVRERVREKVREKVRERVREEEKAEYVRPRNGAPARRCRVRPIPSRSVHHDTGISGKNPALRYIVSREKEHTGMEAVFVVFEGPNRRFGFPPLLCGLYTCLCVKAGPLA